MTKYGVVISFESSDVSKETAFRDNVELEVQMRNQDLWADLDIHIEHVTLHKDTRPDSRPYPPFELVTD